MRRIWSLLRPALALSCIALLAPPATAVSPGKQPRITLEVISTYPSSVPVLGDASADMAERTARASNGEIVLAFRHPADWGKSRSAIDAVGEGKLQASWGSAGGLAEQDSAFGLFYAIPFGPKMGEYMAWLYEGGGLEISHELFHERGVHALPCVLLPASGAGWFRRPVNSLDDFKGMRLRSFSLGAKVLQKVGAETRSLVGSDIYHALKTDEIDGVELLLPAIDNTSRLHTVAAYYYFPSWHKQVSVLHFFINKALWDGFEERDRSLMESACNESMLQSLIAAEANQWRTMRDVKAMGIQLRRLPPEVLIGLEKAWDEVVAEQSAQNANFRRVYNSYTAFRENYALWRYFAPLE